MARLGRAQPAQPFRSPVPRVTPAGTIPLASAGYEIGDGNDPSTMAVEASVGFDVAVYPASQWPLTSATVTVTADTTNANGNLSNIVSALLTAGTAYRVVIKRVSDGAVWITEITAT